MNRSVLSMCQRLALTLVPSMLLLLVCHSSANTQDKSKCTFIHHEDDPKALLLLQSLVGYRFSAKDESGGYEYVLGICTKASKEDITRGGFDEAGVIEVDMKNDRHTTHIIGKFTQAELMSDTDWLMLEYRGGDNYTSHCGKEQRRAIIMIACDPSVISIDDVKVRVLGEENTKKSDCYYMFQLGHHSVCQDPSASLSVVIVPSRRVLFTFTSLPIFMGLLWIYVD